MTPLEAIRIWGLEKLGRYYSTYRALVLDPNPDNLGTGNILVQIPRVQGGIKTIARAKSFGGGSGYGFKNFAPRQGEVVWVEFENGNPTQPLWSYHTWGVDECPDDLKDIKTCGIITTNGHRLLIRESEQGDSILIQMYKGSTLKVTPESIEINEGKNQGLVNIESLRGFIEAVSKDLLIAKSGSNVAQWMSTDLATKLEDKKVTH